MSEKEDLLRVLTGAGVGSRRKIAAAIIEGRVTVNDRVAENLREPVDSRKDRIAIDGLAINVVKERHVYLVLNKPPDVVSTVSDDRGRKTVIDYIPEKYRHLRLYPAGRLDKDTTGLLLMTNDGELTNRLTHPRYRHDKEYLVPLDREITSDEKNRLEKGIVLEDGKTAPAKVTKIEGNREHIYSVVIHEGRKRQVRRMLESLGCRVLGLKRIRIGGLTLGDLKEGEVREIPAAEIRKIFGIK
ncbi:MAG: rRNA pseudouridine synthase [Dehalococcoidales bacterium]|nr:MAG: rRNA pseudouridine synthase [Dehalococcoidales bacterium]